MANNNVHGANTNSVNRNSVNTDSAFQTAITHALWLRNIQEDLSDE